MEPWMVEAAAAELQSLEAEHPDRFDRLKLELRAFISQQRALSSPPSPPPSPSSSHSVATQVSSTARKRRKGTPLEVLQERRRPQRLKKEPKVHGWPSVDSADLAMERAEECLRKIRRLKESLAAGD